MCAVQFRESTTCLIVKTNNGPNYVMNTAKKTRLIVDIDGTKVSARTTAETIITTPPRRSTGLSTVFLLITGFGRAEGFSRLRDTSPGPIMTRRTPPQKT